MRTGPKVKAARLPAINPKNTARVPDLALTPPGGRNPVLFVYPLGSTNKSHGTSHHFFMVFTKSKCVKFHGDLLVYWSSAHLQEHPQWRLDDKCDQKPPQVSPVFFVENMANLGNNMQGKKNILYFYICMFTLSKKYVWSVYVYVLCWYPICMNLQATKSYNFHIIKIVFH